MRQRPPEALVFLAMGVENGRGSRAYCVRESFRLGQFDRVDLGPYLVPVDVLPRLGVREGEMTGPDAHYGTVLVVQLLRIVGLNSGYMLDGPRDARGASEQRAGKFPQRVKVQIVYQGCYLPCDDELSGSVSARQSRCGTPTRQMF